MKEEDLRKLELAVLVTAFFCNVGKHDKKNITHPEKFSLWINLWHLLLDSLDPHGPNSCWALWLHMQTRPWHFLARSCKLLPLIFPLQIYVVSLLVGVWVLGLICLFFPIAVQPLLFNRSVCMSNRISAQGKPHSVCFTALSASCCSLKCTMASDHMPHLCSMCSTFCVELT